MAKTCVCVCTSSVRADLLCSKEPCVASCFFSGVEVGEEKEDDEEGGWTFGEVPR